MFERWGRGTVLILISKCLGYAKAELPHAHAHDDVLHNLVSRVHIFYTVSDAIAYITTKNVIPFSVHPLAPMRAHPRRLPRRQIPRGECERKNCPRCTASTHSLQ